MGKSFIISGKIVSKDNPPKCKLCGSEIGYIHKTGNVYKLTTCTNPKCEAHDNNSYLVRTLSIFGDEAYKEMKKKIRNNNPLCIEYWISRGYSEEEGKKKIFERQSQCSKQNKKRGNCSKEHMLKKMTPDEAELFFKKKSTRCVEYWTSRGYSEEQAIKEVQKIQKQNAMKSKEKYKREQSWRCKEYWMKISGVTEEEAKKIISNKQKTFSKEKCIEKFGQEKGLKIWKERQNKWQESLHKSEKLHVGYSSVSQKLFDAILEKYIEGKDYVFYGSKNHEYCIRKNNQNYIYDFTDLNKRKIIEFNGDIYHGNPKLFEATDKPNPFKKDKTCKDLWMFDEIKKQVANENGFEMLTIWENEYRESNEKTIIKCLKFLEIC